MAQTTATQTPTGDDVMTALEDFIEQGGNVHELLGSLAVLDPALMVRAIEDLPKHAGH